MSDTYRVLRAFSKPHGTHIKTFEAGEPIEFDDAAQATYYVDAGFVASDPTAADKQRKGRKAKADPDPETEADPDPETEADPDPETEDGE